MSHQYKSHIPLSRSVVEDAYTSLITDDVNKFAEIIADLDDINLYVLPQSKYKLPTLINNDIPLLHAAAFFGAEECYNLLISMDASNKPVGYAGLWCQHFAAAGGNLNILRNFETFDVTAEDSRSPMFFAIQFNHFDVVKYLWSKGEVFYEEKPSKDTYHPPKPYLSLACENGNLEIVKFIFEQTPKNRIPKMLEYKYEEYGPLTYALSSGNAELVEFLLNKGVKLEKGDKTPIVIAAETGSLKTVKLLVERRARYANITPGKNPFIAAAEQGHVDIVKYFIKLGIDPNFQLNDGTTALSIAVRNNNVSVVRYLLNVALTLNSESFEKLAEKAIDNSNLEMLNLLMDNFPESYKDATFLYSMACRHRYTKMIDFLLSKNIDCPYLQEYIISQAMSSNWHVNRLTQESFQEVLLNKTSFMKNNDMDQRPIIKIVIRTGNVDLFNYSLAKGAKLSKEIIDNNDIFETAVNSRKPKILLKILSYKPVVKNAFNAALSLLTSDIEMLDVLNILHEYGIKPGDQNEADEFGERAFGTNNPEMVKFAIEHGATFNSTFRQTLSVDNYKVLEAPIFFQRNYYSSFVHCSSQRIDKVDNYLKCLELIFKHGANPNAVDSLGENMFHNFVRKRKTKNYFDFLMSEGVDINHQNNNGETPLIVCIQLGMIALVPRLLDYGADPSIADKEGRKAIHYAANNQNSLYAIACLLNAGADVNSLSNLDETPLINVMRKSDYESCEDNYIYTFRRIRNEVNLRSSAEIALFLIEHGAKIDNYPGGKKAFLERAKEMNNDQLISKIKEIFNLE